MKVQQEQKKKEFKLAYGGRDLALLNFLQEKVSQNATNPLFAMLAYFYLDVGKVAEAISVAQRGVIAYRTYSTGHTVLGMALMRAGFYSEAKKEISIARELRPNSNLIGKLLAELEREERADEIGMKLAEEFLSKRGIMEEVAEAIRNKTAERSPDDSLIPGLEVLVSGRRKKDENIIPDRFLGKNHEPPSNSDKTEDQRNLKEAGEMKLNVEPTDDRGFIDIASLARELESAKPLPTVRDWSDDQGEGLALTLEIVTETLAKILEEQGNFETALEAYRLLVIKKPDRALLYNEKIAELKRKLGNQNE
ncbi:MAG: tetratricopeptide repeat protein [Candidatus Kryptoniota bacterium]